jgi:hypothetical protein
MNSASMRSFTASAATNTAGVTLRPRVHQQLIGLMLDRQADRATSRSGGAANLAATGVHRDAKDVRSQELVLHDQDV